MSNNCARCSIELNDTYSLRCNSCPLRLCLKCHNQLNEILYVVYGSSSFETEQHIISKPKDFGHRRVLPHICWKCRENERVMNKITAFLEAHNKTHRKTHEKKVMQQITAFLNTHKKPQQNKPQPNKVMTRITEFLEAHNKQKNENQKKRNKLLYWFI